MAVAGALFSVLGSVVGMIGGLDQAAAQKKAENAREQQMQLEAMRKRREVLRQGIAQRAVATSNAYNQGAGATSALSGGVAQITNSASRNVLAVGQDATLGKKVFEANKEFADASGLIAMGNGISSIGGAFGNSLDSLQRLGFA